MRGSYITLALDTVTFCDWPPQNKNYAQLIHVRSRPICCINFSILYYAVVFELFCYCLPHYWYQPVNFAVVGCVPVLPTYTTSHTYFLMDILYVNTVSEYINFSLIKSLAAHMWTTSFYCQHLASRGFCASATVVQNDIGEWTHK